MSPANEPADAQVRDAEAPLCWSDALLLGFGPMDAHHQAFVQSVSALQQAADADLTARLHEVAEHLREHFEAEDRWMMDTAFPARDCHMDEHAAVMRSVLQVQALLAQGDASECRRLASELARWFPGHADYLDSALSHWMFKQHSGGKPVVLRRDLGSKLR